MSVPKVAASAWREAHEPIVERAGHGPGARRTRSPACTATLSKSMW
jgi:hypothetical protein